MPPPPKPPPPGPLPPPPNPPRPPARRRSRPHRSRPHRGRRRSRPHRSRHRDRRRNQRARRRDRRRSRRRGRHRTRPRRSHRGRRRSRRHQSRRQGRRSRPAGCGCRGPGAAAIACCITFGSTPLRLTNFTTSVVVTVAVSSSLTRVLMLWYSGSVVTRMRLLLRSFTARDSCGGRCCCWFCWFCCCWAANARNGRPPTAGLPPVVAIALLKSSLIWYATSVASACSNFTMYVLRTVVDSFCPASMVPASNFSMRNRSDGVALTTIRELLLFSATTRTAAGGRCGGCGPAATSTEQRQRVETETPAPAALLLLRRPVEDFHDLAGRVLGRDVPQRDHLVQVRGRIGHPEPGQLHEEFDRRGVIARDDDLVALHGDGDPSFARLLGINELGRDRYEESRPRQRLARVAETRPARFAVIGAAAGVGAAFRAHPACPVSPDRPVGSRCRAAGESASTDL